MRILFFSPFSGIVEASVLEARLAKALRSRGHEVIYVTCGGALRRHCLVMALNGLSPVATEVERSRICAMCKSRANSIRQAFDLEGPTLNELLGPETLEQLSNNADAGGSDIETVSRGVPVGRRALFPFLVYKKRDNLDLSPAEWMEYRDQLQQSMVAVDAAERLIKEYKPDAVITYSSTYSVLSAFREKAQLEGVVTYFVEAGGNLAHRDDRAIFARDSIRLFYESLRELWKTVSLIPAPCGLIPEATDHLLHLFQAKSVFTYSESTTLNGCSIRERFSVPQNAQVLLATMSSYDEVYAAQEAGICPPYRGAFVSQIEWIRWLSGFVSGREDLFLIIRVHPREFPNRRERAGRTSDHAKRLESEFTKLPRNCVINWPSDKISLYDLAKDTDVVLNAWSSAGKELSLLGIPVVEWNPSLLFYPPDEALCALDPGTYGELIDAALRRGWCGDQVRTMYRWFILEYGLSNVRTTGFSKAARDRPSRDLGLVLQRIAGRIHPAFDVWFASRRRIPSESASAIEHALRVQSPTLAHNCEIQSPASVPNEADVLAREIHRLIFVLFGNLTVENPLHRNLLKLADTLKSESVLNS